MRNSFHTLMSVLVLSAAISGAGVVPSMAQTSTMTTESTATRPTHHRRVFRRTTPSASAPARNVGPDSSVAGSQGNSLGASRSGNDGLPYVPGAPGAGGSGSTGGH